MFTARWWERRGVQVALLGLMVGGALVLRQTQGAALLEIYQSVARPIQSALQTMPSQQEQLNNARFMELQTQIASLQSQNQQLKKALGYTEKHAQTGKPVVARVIARSADNWWQQVTLDRGSNDGIQEGGIVQAEGGLIGAIESVTPNTSRVLLISDLKSQVGVTISRTGAKGILRGGNSADAIVEFNEKVPNVKPGDVIATSTYSQKFPAGLAVGQVKSLNLDKRPTSVGHVELFPPIRLLEWVMVYPKPAEKLEQATTQSSGQPQSPSSPSPSN